MVTPPFFKVHGLCYRHLKFDQKLLKMNKIEIPNELKNLAKLSRGDLVKNLGIDVFRNVLLDIFLGRNVRTFTETLTRTRLIQSHMALWEFFCTQKAKGVSPLNLLDQAKYHLINSRLNVKEKAVYEWLVAMTQKQTQNVLRNDHGDNFENLTTATLEVLKNQNIDEYPFISQGLSFNQVSFTCEELSWISLVLGSQTLTIRGSEKSLHGKYFEKLILGSIFQIFGFQLLSVEDVTKNGFWLSSQSEDRREADATIVCNNLGIRVDIGFIGSGNSEITLDKVSRFTKYDEIAGKKYLMSTIVIVDTLGERSKARELAKVIEGEIICMSDPLWILSLAQQISERIGIANPLDGVRVDQLESYLYEALINIDLELLINN